MIKLLTYVLFLMVALSGTATASDPLQVRVVNVLSCDMLVVSVDNRAEIVHLYGVASPERDQLGWFKARDYTRQMVLHKLVEMESIDSKQTGTIQAKVYVGDTCINDALADMLLAGRQGHNNKTP